MNQLVWWLQERKMDYVLSFVLFFAIFIYLQYSPTIGDPDGFYHAKIAEFLSQGRILTTMPWMQFTTLRDAFTDHHFLYHVLLVPFVALGKPLIAVKLATAVFGALFFTIFYWTLKRLHSNAPFLFTLLLLFTNSFVFRLNLIRANSLSLIVFLLIIVAIFEGRWRILFLLNFLYVWLYGGWLLSWVVVALYAGVLIVFSLLHKRSIIQRLIQKRTDNKRHITKIVFATVIGSLLGLVINPFWPQNIQFYLQQVWQIAIVNLGGIINVGGEWSSLSPYTFFQFTAFIAIFFGIGLALTILQAKRLRVRTWFSLVLAFLFIFFTFKSQRYIELSAPVMVLFASGAWSDIFPKDLLRNLWQSWIIRPEWRRQHLHISVVVALVIIFLLPDIGLWAQIERVRSTLHLGTPIHRYEKVSTWLKENTPEHSIVVQSDWDDWPMLFYFNLHNHYIVGLDPTFMYNYDSTLFDQWARFTRDGEADDVVRLVTENLHSQYVMIEKDHTAMRQLISGNIYFNLVYEDDEVWVYYLKES